MTNRARCPVFIRASSFVIRTLPSCLPGLPGLAADLLAGVADALALVGLGAADATNARGHLTNKFLVDALHPDAVGPLDGVGDALGRVHAHWVRIANLEDHHTAVLRGAIADAYDLQVLPKAGGHADDHIVQQRAGQAVQCAVLALVGWSLDRDRVALTLQDHFAGKLALQLPLRSLNPHKVAI